MGGSHPGLMAPLPAILGAQMPLASLAMPSVPAHSMTTSNGSSFAPIYPPRSMGGSQTGLMVPLPAILGEKLPSASLAPPSGPARFMTTPKGLSFAPSPPNTPGGEATAAEHHAAMTLQCWKRRIWLRCWFAQQAEQRQRRLRLCSLCCGASAYAVSV
jgi:hypothetical protein